MQMGSGARLHLLARGAAAGKQYIRSVRLNGVLLQRAWLTHEELERGGELEFVMSGEPVTNWP